MQITTSKGKTFNINWIWGPLRGKNQTMIELKDDRALSEIAADFDGLETITKTDETRGQDVKEIFTGYTNLVTIIRDTAKGTVRLVLEKRDDG